MYINLMSLENGDCVTTFKVGEDRFLNSLLVSDNGRILVCGDESKRPCSLLVWDLQTKKLIYDLKMNHHEFSTRLSAITGDGTYVACVCKVRICKDLLLLPFTFATCVSFTIAWPCFLARNWKRAIQISSLCTISKAELCSKSGSQEPTL